MANKINVQKQDQSLTDRFLIEDLQTDPSQIRRFFTSNIFIRSLSHLFGKGIVKSIPLSCTEAGALKTAPIGSGFQTYDQWGLTFADDLVDVLTPTTIASRCDIWITTHDVLVRHSYNGSTFGGWFQVNAGSFYSFDATTGSVEIKNAVGGSNAKYQVMMWQ